MATRRRDRSCLLCGAPGLWVTSHARPRPPTLTRIARAASLSPAARTPRRWPLALHPSLEVFHVPPKTRFFPLFSVDVGLRGGGNVAAIFHRLRKRGGPVGSRRGRALPQFR